MRLPLSFVLLSSLLVLGACSKTLATPHPPVVIRLGGSDSMNLLAHAIADAYHKTRPYATIEVQGGNSTSGLNEFSRGMLDIALVSRNPRSDELKVPPSRAVEIARDGIVVVVHPSNPLTDISREDLAKVFSGQFLNWSELSGKASQGGDDSIQVISRENGSGTRNIFEQTIMAGRRVTLTALVEPSSHDVLSYVESNPNAIGYASFDIWKGNSTALALSIDSIQPTLGAIRSSSYPLMQTFYLVLPIKPSPQVGDFVDFVLSPPGQSLVYSRMASVR